MGSTLKALWSCTAMVVYEVIHSLVPRPLHAPPVVDYLHAVCKPYLHTVSNQFWWWGNEASDTNIGGIPFQSRELMLRQAYKVVPRDIVLSTRLCLYIPQLLYSLLLVSRDALWIYSRQSSRLPIC